MIPYQLLWPAWYHSHLGRGCHPQSPGTWRTHWSPCSPWPGWDHWRNWESQMNPGIKVGKECSRRWYHACYHYWYSWWGLGECWYSCTSRCWDVAEYLWLVVEPFYTAIISHMWEVKTIWLCLLLTRYLLCYRLLFKYLYSVLPSSSQVHERWISEPSST